MPKVRFLALVVMAVAARPLLVGCHEASQAPPPGPRQAYVPPPHHGTVEGKRMRRPQLPRETLSAGIAPSANMDVASSAPGPDIIVISLPGFGYYGSSGSIHAFALATESCNIGDVPAVWYAQTNQHPVIAQDLYRLENGRFEQIGQAWAKHGFFATIANNCGTCVNPHPEIPPINNPGDLLGVMCSDIYSANLNADPMQSGTKSSVNPHTGVFPYPFTIPPGYEIPTPNIGRRLQVEFADFDPAQHTTALFFAEGQYVTPDEFAPGNQNNNASYCEVNIIPGPNLAQNCNTAFCMRSAGPLQEQLPAIRAWKANDPSVVETDIQLPAEGLFILAAKATDLGTGFWQYEYALYNMNSDRSAGAFTIPLPAGALVDETDFHDVFYHGGEPHSGLDWSVSVVNNELTWATQTYAVNPTANALSWGTLYNFRFMANVEPDTTTITVGLFKPGPFPDVQASTLGPKLALIDCNRNLIHDACDLINCDVPTCGTCGNSPDCNQNSVPDECEIDCNGNQVPDWCDVDPADPDGNSMVSLDCNHNLVPDECEPDCDHNGFPDDCVPPGDRDGDAINDCLDQCPDTNPLGACICPPTGLCCFPGFGCLGPFTPQQCLDFGGIPECQASQVCRNGCLLGDMNDDGDLDLKDFSDLTLCFSGSTIDPGFQAPTPECGQVFDYNLDNDVDRADYSVFQSAFTGP